MNLNSLLVYGGAAFVGTTALARFGLSDKYETFYQAAGARWSVQPEKLHALALQESRENPAAIGEVNADGSQDFGIMQINHNNFDRLGLTAVTVMDAATNINAGAQLLAANLVANPNLNLFDEFSVWNAGWARDATTGLLIPRVNAHGVYVNLAYVLSVGFGWYGLVLAAKLSLLKRF